MSTDTNRILLISCYFPPVGGIQVQRALNLARYLPEEGFQLDVLTVRNPSVPTFDHGLVERIPSKVRVHNAWTLEPPFHWRKRLWGRVASADKLAVPGARKGSIIKRAATYLVEHLLAPDPQSLWNPAAGRKAEALVRENNIGIVLVTAPPFSSFLIGNRLKRKFPHLKLVVDFRDEWLEYFVKQFAFRQSPYVQAMAAEIERTTVELADLVIAAAPVARATIRNRYPEQPEEKFQLVSNGYDDEESRFALPVERSRETIVVAHVGTIHTTTSPLPFLKALDRLPAELQARFEIRFVGRVAEEFMSELLENRGSKVSLLPFVPHSEALREIASADLLLLPCHDSRNIPGKLYEYMAAGRAILAIAEPGGDIDQLIQNTRSGWCVDQNDTSGMESLLRGLCQDPSALRLSQKRDEVEKYTRRKLAGVYAKLIRKTTSVRQEERIHA